MSRYFRVQIQGKKKFTLQKSGGPCPPGHPSVHSPVQLSGFCKMALKENLFQAQMEKIRSGVLRLSHMSSE